MHPDDFDDEQLDELAAALAPRLPTGTHGDRVILPRRAFMGAMGGALGVGALTALGVDEAAAQAAGSQGTPEEPNNMFAYDLNVANAVTSSLPMNGNDIENAGSVSTDEATIGGWNAWTVVDSHTDNDDDSEFDADLTKDDSGVLFIIIDLVAEEPPINVEIRLDNDDRNRYDYRSEVSADTNYRSGVNEITLISYDGSDGRNMSWRGYLKNDDKSDFAMWGNGGARSPSDAEITTRGVYRSGSFSGINIFSDANATGNAILLGRDIA